MGANIQFRSYTVRVFYLLLFPGFAGLRTLVSICPSSFLPHALRRKGVGKLFIARMWDGRIY